MEPDILAYAEARHCQELHMIVEESTQLKGIVAIHNTTLGPALGGCRCITYPSTTAAVIDVIRLAESMTYKAALANLPLGGGKMVLMKPDIIYDRPAYFKAVGRFVDKLNGRYITAVDSGTSIEDMDVIALETRHVASTTHTDFSISDPSVVTAMGVVRGIEAAVKFKLGKTSLKGIHIGIQGLGHAGYQLAKQLHQAGAYLSVFDINPNAVNRCVVEFGVTPVQDLDLLLTLDCDVFAPCALGSILNDDSIFKLKAPIVAGCANNQLDAFRHGEDLAKRNILYAPDYVINAGGLIYVAAEINHITEIQAKQKVEDIYSTLMKIFERAEHENQSTNAIADTLAVERLLISK